MGLQENKGGQVVLYKKTGNISNGEEKYILRQLREKKEVLPFFKDPQGIWLDLWYNGSKPQKPGRRYL